MTCCVSCKVCLDSWICNTSMSLLEHLDDLLSLKTNFEIFKAAPKRFLLFNLQLNLAIIFSTPISQRQMKPSVYVLRDISTKNNLLWTFSVFSPDNKHHLGKHRTLKLVTKTQTKDILLGLITLRWGDESHLTLKRCTMQGSDEVRAF